MLTTAIATIKNYLQMHNSTFFRDGLLTLSDVAPCRAPADSKSKNSSFVCDGYILSVSDNRAERTWTHPCPCFYFQKKIDSEIFLLLNYFNDDNLNELERSQIQLKASFSHQHISWNISESKEKCIEHWRHILLDIYYKSNFKESDSNLNYPWKELLNPQQKNSAVFAQNLMRIKSLFEGKNHNTVSWSLIAKFYDNSVSAQDSFRTYFLDRLATRANLILLLEDGIFSQKSGLNASVTAFENFIEDINRMNLGLVVYCCRDLVQPEQSDFSLSFDYNVDRRQSYRDEKNKMRFTSTRTAVRSTQSMQELLKLGAFDRLLECLSLGQQWLDSVFKEGDK